MQVKEKESKYNHDSIRDDYMTPHPEIIDPLLRFLRIKQFDTEVCCSKKNIPAITYFINGVIDGLTTLWRGICWMNPPFKTMKKWIERAYYLACVLKICEVWGIFPARTENKFWKDCIADNPDCFVIFLRKGLSFIDPATNDYVKMWNKDKQTWEDGEFKHPLAIVYFGKNAEELAKRWNEEQPLPYKAWRMAA